MAQFERCFDTIFDDVFQREDLAQLFAYTKVVTEEDLRFRFALSLIAGQKIVVPAHFLLDHGPFRAILSSETWARFIFKKGILEIGCPAPSLDKLYRDVSGGTLNAPPTLFTTNISGSRRVLQTWEKYGPTAALEEFEVQLPEIKTAFELLKEYAALYPTDAFRKLNPLPAYSDYLPVAAHQLGIGEHPDKFGLPDFERIKSRSDVFRLIESLDRPSGIQLESADQLKQIAIVAKHLQISSWVQAEGIRTPSIASRQPTRENLSKMQPLPLQRWEAPLVGRLLQRAVDVESLTALSNDTKFLFLREEFLRKRREGNVVLAGSVLTKLCQHAADILGEKGTTGFVTLISGVGTGVITNALYDLFMINSLPQNVVAYIVSGSLGGILALAAEGPLRMILNARLARQVEERVKSIADQL